MDKLDKIMDKVVEISIAVAEIRKDIARNTDDLAEHIKRTNLLEKQIRAQAKDIEKALGVAKWLKATVTVCGGLSVIIGLVVGLKGLI